MIVPALRFKNDDGQEFSEWGEKTLDDIIEQMQSGVSRLLNDSDVGLPVIRSNNLINEKLNVSEIKYWYLLDNQGVNLENYYLKEGDLLVNFINSLAQIGKVALFEDLLKRNTIFTTNIMRLSFKKNTNYRFIFCFFQTNDYTQHIQAITKPAVNQASFTTKEFKTLKIPFPSLPEQTKIANFLTAVDEKITLLTQKADLLSQYKKGVMQQIFNQELRFKDEDGQEFPEWEERQADEVFMSVSNKNHNGDLPILAATQDKGMIYREDSGLDIKSSESSVKSYKIVEKGDFVISLRSFQGGIEYSNLMGICSPAYTVMKPKIEINNGYFKAFLKKEDFIERLNGLVIGIRDGKQISYSAFATLTLPYPAIEEQTKIANFLTAVDDKITTNQTQLNAVKQYKQGLLQQMFV
jgi:type I restriction enzyme, S subunit